MKIVIDGRIAQGPRVGLGVYVKNLVESLAEQPLEHQIVLLTTPGGPVFGDACPLGVEELQIAPSLENRIRREIWEQFELPGILKKLEADVYHGPIFTLPCLTAVHCAQVVTFYDASLFALPGVYNRLGTWRMKALMYRASRVADRIICGSEHAMEECARYLGSEILEKAKAIPIALPREVQEMLEPSYSEVEAAKLRYVGGDYLISVGTIQPRKNYERLIKAFSRLERQDLHLVICGQSGWKSESVYKTVESLGIKEKVHFLVNLPTEEVQKLMKGAEIFVFPSLYEGFGIPPLEAFAMGTPVAASSATSVPEVTGTAALYFDPSSIDEMMNVINRILDSPQLATDLADRGKKQLKKFSWDRCAKEHLEAYGLAISDYETRSRRGKILGS